MFQLMFAIITPALICGAIADRAKFWAWGLFVALCATIAYFPVAVLKGVDNFTNGTISVKFKTISGDADRASGILFNVKPNGDWLAIRYNDTENNVALWEFHNGMRRNMRFSDRNHKFMLDRAAWHELKLTIDGADLKTSLDG